MPLHGSGDSWYFVADTSGLNYGDGEYTSPAGVFGKLVQHDDFTFVVFHPNWHIR